MNLHHLELFYYVARHGGISRAVRHIPYGIQQPAVSTQILALEQDLGTKLFDRQPFRLTAAGQELYQFAEPFFSKADEISARLRSQQAPRLRIAAAELVLRDHLPPVIAALKEKHPALRFALRTGFQAEMEAWLHDGEIDLAITPLDTRPQPGLKCLPIVQLPLVLIVPRSSPLKSAAQLWAQERIADPLISLPAAESITRAFQKGLKEMKVAWPTSLEAPSPLIPQYVANGYGLGVTVNLPGLVQHPQVRVLPLPGFAPVEIAALWRPPTTPLVDDLRAIIAARAEHLWPAA
ncbi:LysR family transcriptional regulator [Horticoccus luteus]|uniref:LysR family transcriptional regulator n=1 Tax=Horticoccus luteus TaxID=2862869 RepID=A0A8F9TV28_9BACT|nr:LysR family transcriptional regulator [Horticoccus luteus]QYM78823.1 LysR family transcriptional regulator [Horticoccus luteus]